MLFSFLLFVNFLKMYMRCWSQSRNFGITAEGCELVLPDKMGVAEVLYPKLLASQLGGGGGRHNFRTYRFSLTFGLMYRNLYYFSVIYS